VHINPEDIIFGKHGVTELFDLLSWGWGCGLWVGGWGWDFTSNYCWLFPPVILVIYLFNSFWLD